MCLVMPEKIISIENHIGKVLFRGEIKKINLSLVPKARVGDHVIVHVLAHMGVAVKVL